EIDQLFEVVGHVRPKVVAARAQFARRQLRIADIEQQQRLDGVDVAAALTVEFVLDDIEQPAMESLHKLERLQIERAQAVAMVVILRGGRSRRTGIDHGLASRLTPGEYFCLSP